MIDIKKLRDNFEDVKSSLITRSYSLDEASFKALEDNRKLLQVEVEKLQADRKKLSGEFGKLKSSGADTSDLKKTIDLTNAELETKNLELQEILNSLNALLLDIPNLPHESVPKGKSEKFEHEEISLYLFWLGIHTSISNVLDEEKPKSPVHNSII